MSPYIDALFMIVVVLSSWNVIALRREMARQDAHIHELNRQVLRLLDLLETRGVGR